MEFRREDGSGGDVFEVGLEAAKDNFVGRTDLREPLKLFSREVADGENHLADRILSCVASTGLR